jgi:hypothetical protein
MTAYRQQSLAVAQAIACNRGRPRDLRTLTPDAARILHGNFYGWFERIERGLYGLTPSGHAALVTWPDQAFSLSAGGLPETIVAQASSIRSRPALGAAE